MTDKGRGAKGFHHRGTERKIGRKGAGNAKTQGKRGLEQKITKLTKIGKNFAKNAEFSDIALLRQKCYVV
jgi:hypothetical protein